MIKRIQKYESIGMKMGKLYFDKEKFVELEIIKRILIKTVRINNCLSSIFLHNCHKLRAVENLN